MLVSRSNHLLYHFSITILLHLASFYATKYFQKKLAEMLIEQIIEFKLRGPGSSGRTCTPVTTYFHYKTNISQEKVRVD